MLYWFLLIFIVLLMVAGMLLAASLRKRYLQRTVLLELVNQGNVRSRYQLRAADWAGALAFRFSLAGDRLPVVEVFEGDRREVPAVAPALERMAAPRLAPAGTPGAMGGLQKADQVMRTGSVWASTLSALGTMLPHALGAPLLRAASRIQQGQIRVGRVQQAGRQVGSLGAKAAAHAGPKVAPSEAPVRSAGRGEAQPWAETPSVAPGEALTLELLILSASASKDQQHSFEVVSRSIEGGDETQVVQEGSVLIRGGFWARRFVPQLIILALAVLALLLVTWAASEGILAVGMIAG